MLGLLECSGLPGLPEGAGDPWDGAGAPWEGAGAPWEGAGAFEGEGTSYGDSVTVKVMVMSVVLVTVSSGVGSLGGTV
jgi:hypothetical protein